MNRFGAFAVHLGISLLIFVILGYFILFHWYPDFFFTSDGGWQGIRIVAFVDLVLGPVLTLVVYRKGKPSLRFDLSAIGVFQAVCLIAGTWVVYSERPIAMVFADGTFQSMTADDYVEVGLPVPEFDPIVKGPPYWVTVKLPDDLSAQSEIRREALQTRRPLKTAAKFYVPFKTGHVDFNRDGLSAGTLAEIDQELLNEFLRNHGGSLADYVFLPFGTRYERAVIAIRRTSGELFYLRIPLEQRR